MARLNQYVKTLETLRKAMRKLNGRELEKAVDRSEPPMDPDGNIFRTIALGCGETVELTGPDITGELGDPDYFRPLLEALPHIRMAEGWRLEAAYSGSPMGGKLAFFATDGKSREDFLKHIELDGSPESVWELRLLIIATDVFHLVWHANYGNMCIVTSYDRMKRDARRIECDIDAVLAELEPKERSRLESWDMTPSVTVEGNEATIRYCTFSQFGGFLKVKETVSVKPFKCMKEENEGQVLYECGICY